MSSPDHVTGSLNRASSLPIPETRDSTETPRLVANRPFFSNPELLIAHAFEWTSKLNSEAPKQPFQYCIKAPSGELHQVTMTAEPTPQFLSEKVEPKSIDS